MEPESNRQNENLRGLFEFVRGSLHGRSHGTGLRWGRPYTVSPTSTMPCYTIVVHYTTLFWSIRHVFVACFRHIRLHRPPNSWYPLCSSKFLPPSLSFFHLGTSVLVRLVSSAFLFSSILTASFTSTYLSILSGLRSMRSSAWLAASYIFKVCPSFSSLSTLPSSAVSSAMRIYPCSSLETASRAYLPPASRFQIFPSRKGNAGYFPEENQGKSLCQPDDWFLYMRVIVQDSCSKVYGQITGK